MIKIKSKPSHPPLISKWGLIGVTLALVITLYSGLTGSLLLFVRYHQKIPEVNYADLFLPTHWGRYRLAKAVHFVRLARLDLSAGDPQEAIFKLRAALLQAPANAIIRSLLASVYDQIQRPSSAEQTLVAGFPMLANDPDYVGQTLSYLYSRTNYLEILSLAKSLPQAPAVSAESHAVWANFAAHAAFELGRHAEACDLIYKAKLAGTASGSSLLAKIDYHQGQGDLAANRLKQYLSFDPQHQPIRQQLNAYLKALGRYQELDASLRAAILASPENPQAHLDLLSSLQSLGRTGDFESKIAAYLAFFRRDTDALILLADFAAEAGMPDLVHKIAHNAQTSDQQATLDLLAAEAYIASHNYTEALDRLSTQARQHPIWREPAFADTIAGFRAVCLYGLGDNAEARIQLNALLRSKSVRSYTLLRISKQLAAINAHTPAQEILTLLARTDQPPSEALIRLLEIELSNDAVIDHPEHLSKLLTSRKAPAALLQRITENIGSDRHLLHPAQIAMLGQLEAARLLKN